MNTADILSLQQNAFQRLRGYLDAFDVRLPSCIQRTYTFESFPRHVSVVYSYTDSCRSHIDLSFQISKTYTWADIKIDTLDVERKFRGKGRGRQLITLCLLLADGLSEVARIYGTALENDNYSSVPFYEKNGFEIVPDTNPPRFRKKISRND